MTFSKERLFNDDLQISYNNTVAPCGIPNSNMHMLLSAFALQFLHCAGWHWKIRQPTSYCSGGPIFLSPIVTAREAAAARSSSCQGVDR